MDRVLLFAVFSFKLQNSFFKQKLIWESSLSQGAATTAGKGERWCRTGFGISVHLASLIQFSLLAPDATPEIWAPGEAGFNHEFEA